MKIKRYLGSKSYLLGLLFVLGACEVVDNDFQNENYQPGEVHIQYTGIVLSDNRSVASFSLVNDSSASIQYFGYDENAPHYSTEVLTDSGWVYLMWNWCGTGAEWISLEAGSSFSFTSNLPTYDCTWRVLINVIDSESANNHTLWGPEIEYIHP